MQLTVFERLLLRNIVPQIQGVSFGIQENARILLETMFTEDEAEKLQIKINEDGKGVTWKVKDDKECLKHNRGLWSEDWLKMFPENSDTFPDAPCSCVLIPQEKDCQVSKGVKRVVAEELIRLSESKPPKLSWEHNTLFKKFVENWEKYLEKDEPAP